MRQHNTE